MKLFIDNLLCRSYLTVIVGEASQNVLSAGNNQNRIDRPIRMKKDPTMSSTFRNFVVQAGATVALTGLLGAVLFTVADFATQGVIA